MWFVSQTSKLLFSIVSLANNVLDMNIVKFKICTHILCYHTSFIFLFLLSLSVPVEVISFTIVPYAGCLLEGFVYQLTCHIRGLPDPIITFQHDNIPVTCINCSSTDSIKAITTSILEVNASSPNVGGTYNCRANNDPNIFRNLPLVFCSK